MKELTTFRKYLNEGRLLKEGIPQESEIADYVTSMYDDSVEEREGFQSDVWTKEEYTSPTRSGGSIFIALMKHLKSVGGKDALEGNPDIHLELLSNGDIKWSADVTLNEGLNTKNESIETIDEGMMDKLTAIFDKVTGIDKFTDCSAKEWAGDVCSKLKSDISYASGVKSGFEKSAAVTEDNVEEVDTHSEDEDVASNFKEGKMTKQALKEKIKAEILSTLSEADDLDEGIDYDRDEMERKGFDLYSGGRSEAWRYATEELGIPADEILGKLSDDTVYDAIYHSMQIMGMLDDDELDESSLKEDEDEDVDVEDVDVDIDVEAPAETSSEPGLTSDEMEIQNSLKRAYDTAVSIGDEKLSNQIANSITFFTKTHVVPRD